MFVRVLIITFALSCTSHEKAVKGDLWGPYVKGHKSLYNEGYYVISSSEKALAYVKEKGYYKSKEALVQIAYDVKNNHHVLKKESSANFQTSLNLAKKIYSIGSKTSEKIWSKTNKMSKNRLDQGLSSLEKSWSNLIKGNLSVAENTEENRKSLANLPNRLAEDAKEERDEALTTYDDINRFVSDRIAVSWNDSFSLAAKNFRDEYKKSGEKENSFLALGSILRGHLKAIYGGLIQPSARSIVEYTIRGGNTVIFLPASHAYIAVKNTIKATGLAIYYSTGLGYNIVSPTLESSLLAGLGMLSLSSSPVIWLSGSSLGAINQVAYSAAAPVIGASNLAARTAASSGKYVAFVSYDSASGASKVLINSAQSGVVLGYNALTQIPAHLLLTSLDAAVLLAYDGPNLVIAKITAKSGSSRSPGNLPTGAVIDLDKARKSTDLDVKVLSKDPKIIKNVLEKASEDLKP